ncbi:maleylpyruvate isomerase family mycothiol-dependent enzyme [Nocardioides sp. cx-169]|uniref:maleylpyruvate isomerase family mycothiol-dependent enzyme n=1 Tax=Nocardioides sp. cx-169 TaxID=2899080 RepID=UPI001E3C07F1|nr:maleylpyruvate isomerase family mycothiol-dependent enzyme [Nocardioides sp. cx-169]MCD4535057.1 maleylpyruvate isomerase family mycothiol-dependent enzyme [Nocardioides sp. cx-169]
MSRLDFPEYLEHLRRDSARFRDVLATCDPAARVPACPEWDAADLLWHLAGVQRFWAGRIRSRPAAPAEADFAEPERPDSYGELLAYFDEQSAALLAQLEVAEPAEAAWSWAQERTVGFTFRRQAQEALIHRLDAEQTAGCVTDLDPRLSADGVAELMEVMYGGAAPPWGRTELGDALVRIDMTDVARSLYVRPGMFYGTDPESGKVHDGPHLALDEPGDADATVRGRASDLDAWLWRRRDDAGIEVSGDRTAYDALMRAVSEPLD